MLSIIIITHDREKLLDNCLGSIFDASCPEQKEVIVVVNGDDLISKELITRKYPSTKIIEVEKTTPGEARNIAIKSAQGEYFCFLDDDIIIEESYLMKAVEFLRENPNVDAFGGSDSAYPDVSDFEIAIGITLQSPLATATTRYRHKSDNTDEISDATEMKLILCNLWIKSDIFKREGLKFDRRFFRNEENVLLYQLKEQNKLIKYIPSLKVKHKRKDSLKDLGRTIFRSGKFRMRSMILFPGSTHPLYLAPFFFIFYICSLFFLFSTIYFLPLYVYLALNLFVSLSLSWQMKNIKFPFYIFFLHLIFNITYGIGQWSELITMPFNYFKLKKN